MSEQCTYHIYVRDVPRYSGRGPSGFTMHYNRQQCSRRRKDGTAFCWQHQPEYYIGLLKRRWAARAVHKAGAGDE